MQFGLVLPTRGIVQTSDNRSELSERATTEVVGLAERAERLGFGAIWVGDSILAKPRLDPLATLSALAAATETVTLGTAVYLPNLRHPVNVAHQTATLDQLSGGRLALGVGVGGGPAVRHEHEQMGVPFARRGMMLDETLEVLSALWSGDPVDHNGEFYHFEDASIGFQPAGNPRIYAASKEFDPRKGFPRSIRERIANYADGWLPSAPFSTGISYTPEAYEAGLEAVRGFVADAGRDPDAIDPAYYLDVVVDHTEEAALSRAREFVTTYYTGVDSLTDEQVRGRGVFGPPERVREHLEWYAEAGVQSFVLRITAEDQHEQLDRLANVLVDAN